MDKYLIVDGNAVLHRAYYALPDWRNRSGEATAGVYGFLAMLLKSIDELLPTHLIIVFDTPEPTFRHNMYVGYQHNREKDRQISEDIWGQVEKLKIVFEKMGVPVFAVVGFEADDVIGTLCQQITEDVLNTPSSFPSLIKEGEGGSFENEVIVITGDKDLMQLVTDKVKLFMPQKGLSDNQIINREKVIEKLGVWPEQVTDYKALVGDSSDNYPGVPGIGPKTAIELIRNFGGFEEIYKVFASTTPLPTPNLGGGIKGGGISKGQIQKLIDGYESGELSKRLATIRRDAPVSIFNIQCSMPNKQKMIEVFQELGYKSLITRSGGKVEVKDDRQTALF